MFQLALVAMWLFCCKMRYFLPVFVPRMHTNRYINLRQARVFDQLLSTTFSFVRYNAKPLAKVLLILSAPIVLLAVIGISFFATALFEVSSSHADPWSWGSNVFLVLFVLLAIVVSVGTYASVLSYVSLYVERKGEAIGLRDTWQETKRSFGILVSTTVAIGGVAFLGIGAIALLFALSPVFLNVVMAFVLMPVGCYIAVSLSPLFFMRIYERIGIIDSIKRCFFLIKGYWWSTFGFLIVLQMVVSLLSYTLALPFYAVMLGGSLFSEQVFTSAAPSLLLLVVGAFYMGFYLIGSYLLSTIPLVGTAVQYFNLVERKEARGLQERISEMEEDADDSVPPTFTVQ